MSHFDASCKDRSLLVAILPAFLDLPFERITLKVLSEMSGLNRSALYRRPPREQLYRECVLMLMSDIADAIASVPVSTGSSVQNTMIEFASRLADEFSTERYRKMLYLVVRDRRDRPWLSEGYQHCILGPATSRVANLIGIAGQRQGIALRIPLENAQNFFARLENVFAMAALVPGYLPLSNRERATMIRATAQEAAGHAYCFEEMFTGRVSGIRDGELQKGRPISVSR